MFRNNGFSEIFNFTYTGKCEVPKFILAKSEGTTTETISWQTGPKHLQYQVQYRKPGKKGAIWFEAETTGTTKTLIFLEPATTYEFRVGGRCLPDGGYSFSAVNTFTTPSREEASQYNCGIPPEILITNKKPLEALNPGDKFTAGDFPVKVVEASGGNGSFSGKGVIEVPYLALIKIAVVFDNININTDGQMTGGTVETDYDAGFATASNAGSVNPNNTWIESTEELRNMLSILHIEEENYEVEVITFPIRTIVVNDAGETVVVGQTNEQIIIKSKENIILTDTNGNIVGGINEDGEEIIVDSDVNEESSNTSIIDVDFEAHPNQISGFDKNEFKEYPHYEEKFGKPVRWKSLHLNSTDRLNAIISDSFEKIFFEKNTELDFFEPENATKLREEISLSTLNTNDSITILTRKDSIRGDSIAMFKAISFAPIKRTLGVIYIHEENDDVNIVQFGHSTPSDTTKVISWGNNLFLETKVQGDDELLENPITEEQYITAGPNMICDTNANDINIQTTDAPGTLSGLKQFLNTIYLSANVEFTDVSKVADITVNYDLDKDEKLSTDYWFDVSGLNYEYLAIKESIESYFVKNGDNYDYYVVLVDNPKDSNLLGKGALKKRDPDIFRFTLVCSNSHGNQVTTFYNTVAHELGHGVFDLEHPFHQTIIKNNGYSQGTDPDNFMDYQDGDSSRKYQWVEIHKYDKKNGKFKN